MPPTSAALPTCPFSIPAPFLIWVNELGGGSIKNCAGSTLVLKITLMRKFALTFLITRTLFAGKSGRIDWTLAVTTFSTLVTIGLFGLYVWDHYTH
jgi:hypothetical protein